ncbi:hypothetical protein [Sulfurimonas sp. ST-27]|uniref:hypothetical protein n=1 Tax=Sulfurimonas sp. ST-27 TaxID=3400152 RepID=UPI003AB12D40
MEEKEEARKETKIKEYEAFKKFFISKIDNKLLVPKEQLLITSDKDMINLLNNEFTYYSGHSLNYYGPHTITYLSQEFSKEIRKYIIQSFTTNDINHVNSIFYNEVEIAKVKIEIDIIDHILVLSKEKREQLNNNLNKSTMSIISKYIRLYFTKNSLFNTEVERRVVNYLEMKIRKMILYSFTSPEWDEVQQKNKIILKSNKLYIKEQKRLKTLNDLSNKQLITVDKTKKDIILKTRFLHATYKASVKECLMAMKNANNDISRARKLLEQNNKEKIIDKSRILTNKDVESEMDKMNFTIINSEIKQESLIQKLVINPNADHIFYYLKILYKNKAYYKIGITRHSVKDRYSSRNDRYIILYEQRVDGAIKFEEMLKQKFKKDLFHLALLGTKGTEIFDKDILCLDNESCKLRSYE